MDSMKRSWDVVLGMVGAIGALQLREALAVVVAVLTIAVLLCRLPRAFGDLLAWWEGRKPKQNGSDDIL